MSEKIELLLNDELTVVELDEDRNPIGDYNVDKAFLKNAIKMYFGASCACH